MLGAVQAGRAKLTGEVAVVSAAAPTFPAEIKAFGCVFTSSV